MKTSLRTLVLLVLVFPLCTPAFADGSRINSGSPFFKTPGQPQLVYPTADKIDITGKKFLEFKWIRDLAEIDYYDFRIYRGYDLVASNLMLKKNVPAKESSIKIESGQFQNDKVYTWVLRQISLHGEKSDKSFSSFLIIKK